MRRVFVLIFLVGGVLPLLGAAERGQDAESGRAQQAPGGRDDEQPGSLEGRVTDVRGAPLATVAITVDGDTLEEPLETETDHAGEFFITGLEPGTYSLTAELLGYGSITQDDIPVEAGQVYEIQITLGSL